MDLGQVRKTYAGDDKSWLGSAHGTESTETGTLDVSAFDAETHYPDGFIPSGVEVALITSGDGVDLYGPYDDALTNGQQVAAGFIFDAVEIASGLDVGFALFNHGKVRRNRLPANSGHDAAAEADLKGQIIFIG